MKDIYVVWELIPDVTRTYRLTDLTPEQFGKVIECQGYYIN